MLESECCLKKKKKKDILFIMIKRTERIEKGVAFPYVINDVSGHIPKSSWVPQVEGHIGKANLSLSFWGPNIGIIVAVYRWGSPKRQKQGEAGVICIISLSESWLWWDVWLKVEKHRSESHSGGKSLPTSETRLSDESLSRWFCVYKSKKLWPTV